MPPPDRAVAALRRWATLLDSAFRVPGTRLTFGLDPLAGLVPGIGDLVSPIFAVLVLLHAVRLRIPRIVLVRMVLNALIDAGIGAIPIAGDAFDFVWKSNERNLTLLERHAQGGTRGTAFDWLFVALCALVVIVAALVPLVVGIRLAEWFAGWI
ncbi:MAG TPA: DUF4112 domain-containing protein [Vicinamibacterales bacterium]|nr:DUF4112 domain-containing protein [Vicinamibacterales bacterium]